jgi:hypothetical protein
MEDGRVSWIWLLLASLLGLAMLVGTFIAGMAYGAKHAWAIMHTPLRRDRKR